MPEINLIKNFHEEKIDPNENLTGDSLEMELINKFDFAISSIEEKFSLLGLNISEELKLNILRSQVSLLLSAVDFYIHEIIKIELLNIIKGERKQTPSLKNCMISVQALLDYLSSLNINNQILEEEIVYRNSFKSFLAPKKMTEALTLISGKKIFKNLFQKLNFSKAEELTDKLTEIFERRNSIVHQMDYNFSTKKQQTITKEIVEDYINFYKKFIHELHILLLQENI
ncbi:MAG: HEPN domain-containing protein [Fusobacterium sp.]|uniref:HEPN domain-containing protein n=1 Tax=Fusobacterium sp. TaxID=68766 RepID=UPI00399B9C66